MPPRNQASEALALSVKDAFVMKVQAGQAGNDKILASSPLVTLQMRHELGT